MRIFFLSLVPVAAPSVLAQSRARLSFQVSSVSVSMQPNPGMRGGILRGKTENVPLTN